VQNKARSHVAMWGGLTQDNANDHRTLAEMLHLGAVGLKAFMCPSGINDFPPVSPCASPTLSSPFAMQPASLIVAMGLN
jgi:dihydroorotase-like cyclic amidohydrolase